MLLPWLYSTAEACKKYQRNTGGMALSARRAGEDVRMKVAILEE